MKFEAPMWGKFDDKNTRQISSTVSPLLRN